MHLHVEQNLLESGESGATLLVQLSARMACSHGRPHWVKNQKTLSQRNAKEPFQGDCQASFTQLELNKGS